MKFIVLSLAVIGVACGALLPDSATQGPNPQDIATPEPEYIDIDLPEPPRPAAPAPAPIPIAAPAPIQYQARSAFAGVARPIQRPGQSYLPPQRYQAPVQQFQQQQLPGHVYSSQNGYQYRRPVYIRRVYRYRY